MPWLDLARSEREDFAAFLESLSPEQWEAATLCERWNVREVVAHAISFDELHGGALVRRFLKGWLSVDRINQVGVDDYADHTAGELIALIRTHAEPRGLTAGFGGRIALTDNMIHQQDIRRPLHLPRTIDDRRLRVALDFALTAPTIRGARRTKRLHLVATDLDWSHGEGPEVEGPGEALLMAMAGRRDALRDLSGPGKAELGARM
ncbi:maleylpyruvate isomerase family mycothiol-dependent enzyme [Mycolicibacterium stellerae]|uniref:maleylpyruvate isomerase family mycothiol-dependent enzyme n=1 Tax=Mycolicibacterium stellerae TaxID=2358193 RepID=UPI000F0BADD0|nr:maleylpyruvate isomerase family mycothiol-dependent enzyme [Mycolicibacterium stellerae]